MHGARSVEATGAATAAAAVLLLPAAAVPAAATGAAAAAAAAAAAPPPPPQPLPAPDPVADDEPLPAPPAPAGPVWSEYDDKLRLALGLGVSGTLEPNEDLEFTAGTELHWDHRIHGIVSVGVHGHLSLRQWVVIADAYKDLYDLDQIDAEDTGDGEKIARAFGIMFGWMGAWLAGTGLMGAGPHVTLSSPSPTTPWMSIGSSVLLSIDTRDPVEEVVLVHALQVGLGWDLGRGGFSVRAQYAPADGLLVGSTGSPVASVIGAIEIVWDEEKLRERREKRD